MYPSVAVPGLTPAVRQIPGGAVALSSAAALSLERADAETSEAGEVSRNCDRLQFQHLEEAGIDALAVNIGLKRKWLAVSPDEATGCPNRPRPLRHASQVFERKPIFYSAAGHFDQTKSGNCVPPFLFLSAIHRKLSRAIKVLRDSSPVAFGVETPGILASKEWGPVKESMGQATRRVLPTDQVK